MTQEELSLKCGVYTSEISRLEHGRGNPQLRTLKRLAEGLGHPCSHIFTLEEIYEREQGESS